SELRVQAAVRNEKSVAAEVTGEILVSAANGFRRSLPFTVSVPPDSMKVVSVQTKLGREDTHPWHFDDPFLYTSQVTIREKGEVLHQVSDFFGFRKLEVDNKTYSLKLNNEVIRVMGFNLVPDDRTTGNTLPAWRVKEDIDLIKSFGANMSRLTHLPLHKEMLDYLDQKGIMIYAEIPLWGFDQLADKKSPVPKEWLKRLITDNFNHPCIIGWGVGNEIGDYPQVMEYVEDAIRYVRSLDTTRMAVMVSHTAHRKPDPIQYSDLGLINRYGTAIGRLADSIHLHHPEKTLFYAEYGYNQFSEDINASFDVKGMVDSLRFKPYLVGGSLWTFNDYRSSYPATKEVSENRAWGIVDVFRQKKRAYHALKKEYSPVREFIIQNLDTGLRTASLLIKPRKLLDLPAYILKDYLVTWKAMDQQEKVIRCGSTRLPLIRPGDPDITKSINWKGPENIMSLQVHLVSPLHYSVYDTTIYFGKPQFPEINYAVGFRTEMNNLSANRGSIRVGFGRAAGATAYKLKYGKHDLSQETLPTIDQYIDLPGLAFNDSFQVSAVAINTVGESASPVQTVQVGTGSAPTLIYYTEPADKGFFVGYVSSPEDYLYKVQYSTVAGSFENASLIQSGTKGVLFVPGLENGRQYFFRVRTVKHNMYEGPWSETRSVIPDGGMKPPVPLLQGVVFDGNEAVIFFKPVKKSTGYLLQFRTRDTDEWVTQEVNASQVEHIRVRTTVKNKPQEFRMASVNAYGQSPFSDVMTAEKSM
ncbi:MAG TPA: glycoside hydrolase family 2 TIM barrel-domain containing protein, partial [Chitinophagaceae bacterium]|nr:glycoside hydrolase family 2 TIM barrel-domain containing protein [Chitinophagaceae bacterium]